MITHNRFARLQFAVAVAVTCTLLFAAITLGVHYLRPFTSTIEVRTFSGAVQPARKLAPDFRLLDQQGLPIQLSDLRGEVIVLAFLYTSCRDDCPLIADQIRGALDNLKQQPVVLAITVDPEGDTPRRINRFLVNHHLSGRMHFLSASREQLEPLWRHYGIAPQSGRLNHSDYVLLIDREGHRRVSFTLQDLTPDALTHDLRLLLEERSLKLAS